MRSISRVLAGHWMLLVTVVVVAVAGFTVHRLHALSERHTAAAAPAPPEDIRPFNPKHVVLEVFGAPGAVATINYLDADATVAQVRDAPLPWSHLITSTAPAVLANLVAQGDGDVIGCRITVNGVVKDERTVSKVSAYTYCLDKAA